MPICYVCRGVFPLNDLQEHFRVVHNISQGHRLSCGEVQLCSRFYSDFHSLRRHLISQHSEVDDSLQSNSLSSVRKQESAPLMDRLSNLSTAETSKSCGITNVNPSSTLNSSSNTKSNQLRLRDMKKKLYDRILTKSAELYGTSSSRSQIQYFFDTTKEIMNFGLHSIQEELNYSHHKDPHSSAVLADVDVMFQSFKDAFSGLNTEHKRIEALAKTGDFIAPVEFLVGENHEKIKRSHDGEIKKKSSYSTGILFPLNLTLKKIFELPKVYDLVFSYKEKLEHETMVISNYMQSQHWKRKIRNFKSEHVLPLFLFFDDFETGNALGSHAGTNKLGGVYVSLPCFPPEYQSSLSSMLNVLLFHSKDRQQFGNFAVFRTLLDELRFLESDGLKLDLPSGPTTIYFQLALIIGDNLGLHSLLGFVENFNANYSCRFCMMDKTQRSLATMENDGLLRTTKSYEIDFQKADMSITGIKDTCIFHSLSSFHVTDNLSVDMMHDLLRGVCEFDMVPIIQYYTSKEKLFTLEELNTLMRSHDYGKTDCTNRPPEIQANHLKNANLRMSAAEMYNFVCHFGVIVGHLVPLNNPVWEVYCLLRQILTLVSSNRIQIECSELLKSLVKEHHRLARTVLGRELRPKDHLLIHYGSIMAQCGPVINLWAMRFEAKHKESKDIAVASNSRTNICKTIATKLQLKLAYQLRSNQLFTLSAQSGPTEPKNLKDLLITFDRHSEINLSTLPSTVDVSNWIEKNGSTYKLDMIVHVDDTDESDCGPQFGVIKHIFTSESVVHFIVVYLKTIFNSHVQAYQVTDITNRCNIIPYENLSSSRPFSLITACEKKYIVTRCLL